MNTPLKELELKSRTIISNLFADPTEVVKHAHLGDKEWLDYVAGKLDTLTLEEQEQLLLYYTEGVLSKTLMSLLLSYLNKSK